jgi:uncharacterized protein YktB (UPF0637 family)
MSENSEFKFSSIYKNENPEKEMDEFERKIKSTREDVFEKSKEVFRKNELVWVNEKIDSFSKQIVKRYKDVKDRESYVAWHVLCGSNVLGDDRKIFKNKDFFGKLSVEKFFDDLLNELEEIKNSGKSVE